jgi:hemerythrin-like domain-containing protein
MAGTLLSLLRTEEHMDAIETLQTEHRTIERAIDALAQFAKTVVRGGGTPVELQQYVTFIREFADEGHHGKEEDVLFAALVDAGFPSRAGPVAVMLHEHELGRAQVRALDALSRKETWTREDRDRVAELSSSYGELLRAHIQKEDCVLYPLALQRLPPEVIAKVDAECAAMDARRRETGTEARLRTLAEGLIGRA